MNHRSVLSMIGLTIITLGIYLLYWLYVTKQDLNNAQPIVHIPTFFLFFVPFANFYFLYKFAQGFCQALYHDQSQTLAYFLALSLLLPIGTYICQAQINESIKKEIV